MIVLTGRECNAIMPTRRMCLAAMAVGRSVAGVQPHEDDMRTVAHTPVEPLRGSFRCQISINEKP